MSTFPASLTRSPVVGERGVHEPVGIAEVLGDAGGLEEGFAVGGVAGLALGGAETDEQVAVPSLVVVGLV